MKLIELLQLTEAPEEIMTIISNTTEHDESNKAIIQVALYMTEKRIESYKESLKSCNSDAAWWSIKTDLTNWEALLNILKSSLITGVDNLPNIPIKQTEGNLMDVLDNTKKFGEDILKISKKKI
jgi:hypothetical protein